jgi:CheY-like chemotaxis protein
MQELNTTILIVVPNDGIRKLLIAQCRELGLIAHGVASAKQATRLLPLASYNVLLVD